MLIKHLSKRERYVALATLTIIFAAAAYSFLIEPISSRRRQIEDEIRSKIAVFRKDSKILSTHRDIESDYARFSKYVKSLNSDEEAMAEILTLIETVSRNDSCLIVNIKPAGVKDMGSHKEVLIDVTAEADIEKFSKFLFDIENLSDMILEVKRFTLSSKSAPGTLKGTFLISKISID